MSSFRVRPFEPGDEEGILDLFNRVFAEGNPGFQPRSRATWDRIYAHNPAGSRIMVGVDADGRIVANYSALPAPAVVRGERRSTCQAVDSCVDRAWRGSLRKNSLFVVIANEFIRHFGTPGNRPFDDYMYGLPNEQAFPVGTRIIGYQPVHVPMPVLARTPDAAWIEGLRQRAQEGGVSVDEIGPTEPLIAALFEQHLGSWPLGIWRDAGWLAWRYGPRPDGLSYGALRARRGGRDVAVAIYRLGWLGQPILPLVDWIGDGADRAALAGLLGTAAGLARDKGGTRVETWVTPNMPHAAVLADLGLAPEASRFNLCIMTFAPDVPLEWAKANWCLTMGDSDIY